MPHSFPIQLSWLRRSKLGRRISKARVIARNRDELGASAAAVPWLAAYDFKRIDPDGHIREVYKEYVNTVSTPDEAISLELASLLWFILETRQPKSVVDLGSGFSSYLFRYYQQLLRRLGQPGRDCRVISCDDNETWLCRTADFLRRKNLSHSGLLLWDRFLEERDQLRPDLILHDLGNMPVRVKTLPQALNLCGPQTIVIIDDVHKPQMRRAVLDQMRERNLVGHDLTHFTYDSFGRYAWMLH